MKRASLSLPKVSKPSHSRLRGATKSFTVRLVLISAVLLGLISVSLLYVTRTTHAATFTATASGAWNLGATWGNAGNNVAGSGFPGAADTANIPSTFTVTIASGRTEACTTLTLNSTNGNDAALNFTDSTSALNVSGTATIRTPNSGAGGSVSLSVDAGTFSCDTLTFVDNTKNVGQLRISSGSATVTNNITMVGGVTRSRILFTGAGTLNVGGALTGGGIVTASGCTVNYNGAAQTIFPTTYENLTLSGSGTKTMSGPTTVSNTCTVSLGTTLDESSRTTTMPGGATLVVNGTLDFTDTAGLIQSGNSGTTTLTMGTSGLIRTLDSAGLGPATGASLQTQAGGAWVVTSISTNGTVEYNRNATSGQTVTDRDYNNLTITGSTQTKTWTLAADRTVNGTVTLNASAPLTLSGTQTVNVKGNWSNSGAFTAGTSTINFNGAVNQSIGGSNSTTFATLAISNTGAGGSNIVSLARDTTVNTALGVTSGVFDQGASFNLTTGAVTVSSGATMQNSGTGDLTLSGGVANSGTINYNANGAGCPQNDDILIRSSVSGTQRAWSGTGAFSMTDVDVKDQAGTAIIGVRSGTNSGNNGANWLFVSQCSAYTWTGVVSTDWTNAANWSPARVTPATSDIVFFGAGTPSPTVTNVAGALAGTNETIAELHTSNSSPSFSTGGGANTLNINAGVGVTGFDVSSLNITGSNALTIKLASGTLGTISGAMTVAGGGHRLISNDTGAITFASGSFFTTSTAFTGNAFGDGSGGNGAAGSIVFASGSTYSHNAGNSPFGASGNPSVVTFQTGSFASYFTATGFDANGRTYATLEIGKTDPGGIVVNASDGGSGNFQFDNLVMNSTGTTSSTLTFTGSGTNTITIRGNISSVGVGSGSFPDIILTAGSGGIQINKPGGGAVTFGNSLNTRSIDFESDTTVDANTTVNLARIVQMGLSPTNTITVNGTLVPNALSAVGYVIGKEKRTFAGPGPVDFTFHVGTVNGYSPMDAKNTVLAGDLTVTATQTTAPVVDAAKSLKRFWTLSGSGITTDLTFYYLDPTDIPVTSNESNYRVIRVSGGTSVSVPNNCPSPTVESACVDFANNKATVPGVNSFSDWTLGENVAPTAVRLTGFTATTRDDGVRLEWKSGFEVDNLGYNLYRYQDGRRTRVTPSLIAGSSLIRKGGRELSSGFSYGWFDSQGTVGTQYELEAIDLRGDVQTFAPRYEAKSGSHGDPKKGRATMMAELTANGAGEAAAHGWIHGAANAPGERTASAGAQALATQQSIAAQPAVKILVNQTSWYRVTQPQLVAAGLSAGVDARKLQLFVDGVEVPIRLSTNQSTLGAGDTLEFYGVALDTLTTDTRTYYLVSGTRNGLRIATTVDKGNAKPKTESLAPNFLYTVESKERFLYLPGLLNGDNDNIFGQLVRSDPAIQTVTLKNLDATSTSSAQLEVIIQGFTEVAHSVQVQLNGSYLGTIDFSGTEHKSSTLPVNPALLREGDNTVTLTGTGSDADASLVDALRITYARTYRADNDSLSFSVGDRSAFVGGFSSAAIRVIDVTNPGAVKELAPKITQANGSFGFTIQTASTVQNLIAFVDNLARQPASMARNQPSTWNASTNAADMVIVTHGDFRQSADTLATARRAQGLNVSVVDIEDVYDEFSYGAHTPEALKDFLAWSNTHWATAPRYALLFGDSSWDPRNYVGQGANDFVPTKLVASFELETGSDDWLADFDGDGIAEVAVGRLPARTSAEASTMVSKILTYDQERASGAPLRGALLVSDSGFESQTAQVQTFLAPLTTVQTLSRSAIGNDNLMRTQIVSAIDQGPTIVNYFGHGSVTVWTGAGLLNEDNASTLNNGSRVSLFVMMTCLNGYSHDAYIDSLAEEVLKDSQGGAFAVWASSGITDPVGQAQMNTQLYQALLGNTPMTLGDAVRQAKLATSDNDVRRTWILLGDPTMRLK